MEYEAPNQPQNRVGMLSNVVLGKIKNYKTKKLTNIFSIPCQLETLHALDPDKPLWPGLPRRDEFRVISPEPNDNRIALMMIL